MLNGVYVMCLRFFIQIVMGNYLPDIDTIIQIIIPVVVAIFTVYVTEYFAKKRDIKQKRLEIKLKYLQEKFNLINDVSVQIEEFARDIDSCLHKENPDDRWKMYNHIIGRGSEINIKMRGVGFAIDSINRAMGNSDVAYNREKLFDFTDNMINIFYEYIKCPNNADDVTQLLQVQKDKAVEQLRLEIDLIADKIANILKE